MMTSITKKIILWSAIIMSLSGVLTLSAFTSRVFGERVSNYSVYDEVYIKKRAAYRAFKQCYDSKRKDKILYNQGEPGYYVVPSSTPIVVDPKATIFSLGGDFNVPAGFFVKDQFSCFDSSNEKNGFYQLATISSKKVLEIYTNNLEKRNLFYNAMGYNAISSSQGESMIEKKICYQYEYIYQYDELSGKSNMLCLQVGGENDEVLGGEITEVNNDGAFNLYVIFQNKGREIVRPSNDKLVGINVCNSSEAVGVGVYMVVGNTVDLITTTGCHSMLYASNVKKGLSDTAAIDYMKRVASERAETTINSVELKESEPEAGGSPISVYDEYAKSSYSDYRVAVGYLEEVIGDNEEDILEGAGRWAENFNATELYYIYMKYARSYYEPKVVYSACSGENEGEAYIPIVFSNDGGIKEFKWCPIDNYGAIKNEKSSNNQLRAGSDMSKKNPKFSDILEEIRSSFDLIDIDKLPAYNEYFDTPGTPQQPDVKAERTCMSAGGGGALSWLLCPALELLSGAAQDVWKNSVSPALRIEPRLFSKDEDGGTRQAWGVFQGIANTFFVILLLFVIFSQLTGVGIDNYGIKKILPKLIIAAVLINLSYWICLVMVDLSNIVGNGFQALFSGLPVGDPQSFKMAGMDDGDSISLTTASDSGLFGIGLLVLLVGGIFAKVVFSNPAVLLSLLVSALGIAIAIFFLFVLLSAREAGVVVLTVISPLAFACNMLPNTKKLFDKWVKLGQGLLLVYPICGLLVGGGDYISRLLMSVSFGAGGDFMRAFMAMIVGIVPIFFIPSVLKSSFAAMGKVGATLSGLGNRARGAATGRMRKTEAYQNAQRMGLERKNRIRAGLNKEGQLTARGERKAKRAKFFGTAATRRQAARVQSAKKTIGEAEAANAVLAGAMAATGIAKAGDLEVDGVNDAVVQNELGNLTKDQKYYYQDFLDSANKGSVTGMNAAIQAMKASGMKDKDIAKILRFAINNGQIKMKDKDQKDQWMREIGQKYGNDFLATDFELAHYMRSGGVLNNGNLGGYGEYAQNAPINIEEFKPEDFLKLSGDSLAGLAASGRLTSGMAKRIMALNPNISEDKRIMFGAIASEVATGGTNGTITSAKDFKRDAEILMNNHSANTGTIVGTNAQMVGDWVRNTPVEANVVQRFANPEEDGQRAPVWTTGDGGGLGGPGGPGGLGGLFTDEPPEELKIDHAGSHVVGENLGGVINEINDNFQGETHINSKTGRVRTYDYTDIYPRLKGESNEAYGERIKRIRQAEQDYINGAQTGNNDSET